MQWPALLPLCLAFVVAGCGEGGAPADALDARWTIVEELRVGSVGDGPGQFGYLKGLVVFDDGRFAVLDSQAREIRVFDAEGAHVATHGHRGQGPGEMEFPNGLLLGPGGLLWVPDNRNARMSLFHPDRGFVEARRYTSNITSWMWDGAMGADGRVFAPAVSADDSDVLEDVLVVYDSAMVALDTLALGTSRWGAGSYCWSPSEGLTNCVGVPFYAGRVRFVDADGWVWEREAGLVDYRIRKWEPGGDTALVVVGDRPALPVTAAERDSAIAELQENTGGDADFDLSKIPSAKPVVEHAFLSAEGNLWVGVAVPGGQATFDVWSPNGLYLGTALTDVAVYKNQVTPVVRGDQVWLVAADELGVEYVVRGRLAEVK